MSVLSVLSIICAVGSVVCAVITHHCNKEIEKLNGNGDIKRKQRHKKNIKK